ncbi:MAG: YraN family protein [Tidjanibacter sp.]|nr:YraN family protein [Tidjanibacter sp.]
MANTLRIGAAGEKAATEYVRHTLGYTIAELNWRSGHHEVDIIAISSDGHYHFVEVKTRGVDYLVSPEEAITPRKINNLVRSVNHYVALHEIQTEVWIDFIGVVMQDDEVVSLNFIPDISNLHW